MVSKFSLLPIRAAGSRPPVTSTHFAGWCKPRSPHELDLGVVGVSARLDTPRNVRSGARHRRRERRRLWHGPRLCARDDSSGLNPRRTFSGTGLARSEQRHDRWTGSRNRPRAAACVGRGTRADKRCPVATPRSSSFVASLEVKEIDDRRKEQSAHTPRSLDEQLGHATEELITGDSDHAPLSEEAIVEMLE